MKKMLPAQFFGYVLASSSAALPMSLKIAHDKLGVSKEKTNFVIPLGATINMNGGAIHLATCTLFIAQLWNVEFGISQYVTLVTLCVFGAIGTAPIPGVATFLLTGILASMGLPMEAVGIILAVDRLLDMVRTLTNVTGDVFSAVIIDKLDKTMDVKKYAS